MGSLRRLSAVLTVVGLASGAAAAAVTGCSSDDTVTTGDAGGDQETKDAPSEDSGSDTGSDAGIDVVVPPDLPGFVNSMADAICTRFAQCCTQTDPDGGFDKKTCMKSYNTGWEFSGGDLLIPGVSTTNLNYDQTKAKDCLTKVLTFSCPKIGAAEFKAATAACFGVATGKLAVGAAGCHSSVECVTTGWCDVPDGGDGGTCQALLAANTDCTGKPTEACAYRGVGAFCDDVTHKCTPPLSDGTACSPVGQFEGCQSGLCDDNFVCGQNYTIVYPDLDAGPDAAPYPGFCKQFPAGDGG